MMQQSLAVIQHEVFEHRAGACEQFPGNALRQKQTLETPAADPLVASAALSANAQIEAFLGTNSILGFAWADAEQIVRERFGKLTQMMPLNMPICKWSPAFFGLEKDILSLQDEDHASLTIPKVAIFDGRGFHDKLSVEIAWDAVRHGYGIVVFRSEGRSGTEDDLIQQIRSRRLAEENFRRANDAVVEKQNFLDVIASNAPTALALLDLQGRIVFATRYWAEAFDLHSHPITGASFGGLFPGSASCWPQWARACKSGREVITEPVWVTSCTGKGQHVRWHHWPWRGANTAISGVVTFAEIVTDIVTRQQSLEMQNRSLARVNADLEDFCSIIAHDLRAPLRSLSQSIGALSRKEALSATADTALNYASLKKQVERIDGIIKNLLAYSLAAHKAACIETIDVADYVERIWASFARDSGFELRIKTRPAFIDIAPAPLDLVLRNLLGNALQHHHRAKGVIQVEIEESHDGLRIDIHDDGPGIQAKAPCPGEPYSPFYNVYASTPHSSRTGLGLGLELVRRTIERNGGTLNLLPSQVGTHFMIHWPVVKREAGET